MESIFNTIVFNMCRIADTSYFSSAARSHCTNECRIKGSFECRASAFAAWRQHRHHKRGKHVFFSVFHVYQAWIFVHKCIGCFCCVEAFRSTGIYGQNGYTALMRAAREGHTECVRLLLESGADTEAKTQVRNSEQSASVFA